jgi:hypothetical protein
MATQKRKPHVFNMPSHFQVAAAWQSEQAEQAERASRLVGTIPQEELPDESDRNALMQAVCDGEVEDVYQPVAASYHNATLPDLPAWVDPRIKVADWAALKRDGLSADGIRTVLIERDKARGGA